MNGPGAPATRRQEPVVGWWSAGVLIAAWLAAVASAQIVGMWLAVGGATLVLGAGVAVRYPRATGALLRPSLRLVSLGVVAGALMSAASYVLHPVLVALAPFMAEETTRLYAAFRAPPMILVLLAFVPVTLGEELVWRGAVQASFAARMGPWRGVAATAGVYALAATPTGSPLLILVSLAWGAVWGALRAATGSLVPPLLAHLTWSAVVLVWFPLAAIPFGT